MIQVNDDKWKLIIFVVLFSLGFLLVVNAATITIESVSYPWENGTFVYTMNDSGNLTLAYPELPSNMATGFFANMTGNVLLMHLNDGEGATTFEDTSGEGNNLNCSNCPIWNSSGKFNGAFDFDGNDDVLSSEDVPTNVIDNWTMMAWINPSKLSQLGLAVQNGFDDGTCVSGCNGYGFGIGNGAGLAGNKFQGLLSGVVWTDSGYTFPFANQWYHLVMLRDSGTLKFYVNGNQTENTFTNNPNAPTASFKIGSQEGFRFFNGTIDEVALWNRSLSAEEILEIYNTTKENHYATEGNYTSQIFGDGTVYNWTIGWEGLGWINDSDAELPANMEDTSSEYGGFNMTGNVLLMHLNSDSNYGENETNVYDFSGNGNNGTKNFGYNETLMGLGPDYRLPLSGDENDTIDGFDRDGGTSPSYVDNIIPNSPYSQCGDYNGSADTNLPNKGDLNDGTTYDHQYSFWFEADTIDTTGNGRVIYEEGGAVNWISIYVHEESGTDYLYFTTGEDSGTSIDYVKCEIITGNVYHGFAKLDVNPGSMYLYLDGVQCANKTGGLNIGTDLAGHTSNPSIGGPDEDPRGWDGNGVSGGFDGRIADVTIWGDTSGLLSEDNITRIYERGAGAQGKLNTAFNFDGVDGGCV